MERSEEAPGRQGGVKEPAEDSSVDNLVCLYEDGHSIADIAVMFGLSNAEVRRTLYRLKPDLFPDRRDSAIRAAHSRGVTIKELSERYGLTPQTLSRICSRP